MKVYIINYQSIFNGRCANALGQVLFKIAPRLSESYRLYYGYVDKPYGSNVYGLPGIVRLIMRVSNRFSRIFRIPYHVLRTLEEALCDYFYAGILKNEVEDYILVTTMYSPRAVKVARINNKRTIFIAGNHNDNLYYDCVREEKMRLGLDYSDVFDSSFRISYYRRMLENLDSVVVFSSIVAKYFPITLNKIILGLPYYLNNYNIIARSYSQKEKFVIGYIGHTTLLKGIHLLGEAVAQSSYKDKIKIIICGNIDERVLPLVDKYNLDISYLGFIKNEDKNDFFNSLHLLVVPSLYDAGPTTALEAAECELPVIISSGCGASELFDDYKTDCVYTTKNVVELRQRIENAVINYPRVLNIAKKHREMVLQLSNNMSSLEEYIKDLLESCNNV